LPVDVNLARCQRYCYNSQNNQVTFVPNNEVNTDYQAIQEWIQEGGTVIDNPPQENN
jgi:hypothetical protein